MPDQPIDRVASILHGYSQAALDDLERCGEIARPSACVQQAGGWGLVVFAFPLSPGTDAPLLSECERDCLRLLIELHGEPISGVRARKELERRKVGIYGLATVKRSLANLHLRLGLVANARRGKRGYYLPEALPIVQRIASGKVG